jgi:hypothetical protein
MAVSQIEHPQNKMRALGTPSTTLLAVLLALGLVLRLAGLPFNGTHDLDEIIFKWGSAVRELGLARGFDVNYGVFSYALYGIAVTLAEYIPRFWWLPYKVFQVSLETGVLWALYMLLPLRRKPLVFWLYWLNPWFILHGAWQGFWDGPHTFLALLAVLCLAKIRRNDLAWACAGICLMAAAMFKPQGLVYFVIPVGCYLSLQAAQRRLTPLLCFTAGLMATLIFATGLLVMDEGGFWQIPNNFLTAAKVMPNLCNGCLSIWRPITILLYAALGPDKFDSMLGPLGSLNNPITLVSFGLAFALVALLAWRVSLNPGPSRHSGVLLVLAFSSLVIPQLTTHAHINHAYAGLVLLIPFVLAQRRMLVPWVVMVAIHFYSHLAVYQMGRGLIRPEKFFDNAPAQVLLARVNAAIVAQPYGALLQFQNGINQAIRSSMPVEPVISQLSVIQFLCVLMIVREMFIFVRAGFGTCSGR